MACTEQSTILVVDDDVSVRTMLGYLFHDEGYEVHEAADGADEFLNTPVDPERLSREVRWLLARTPAELPDRREVGLADARARDRLEAAFDQKPRRR